MGKPVLLHSLLLSGLLLLAVLDVSLVNADDPYRFYTWTVTYGTISPLGAPQQVILINGQFPGPQLDVVTNDNLVLNLINKLDVPFLLTWNGIKQRKNSWQDGVLGTNCPIPPGSNYTYNFQPKDQIGSFNYFPSTGFHRAAGGYGAINVYQRPRIPIPYATPDGDFTLLVGDWYKTDHKALQASLDSGNSLPLPDGVLINGHTQATFSGDQGHSLILFCHTLFLSTGKTYKFRVSNVGLKNTLNFRIQGHTMKLIEVEGSHVVQNMYDSLDVHVGQSVNVLVTLNQAPKDYYIVASTRFTPKMLVAKLSASGILHYSNSKTSVSGPLPAEPTYQLHGSMLQARTYRWNLTSNAARPNPQGSFHYGTIKTTKTIVLSNSATKINGKQRYAVNGVSYVNPDTPLKLADYFNIPGVFSMNSLKTTPTTGAATLATSVVPTSLHDFIEFVFQNNENTMQSWHLDGSSFWVVGNKNATLQHEISSIDHELRSDLQCSLQVYPNSWTAILVSLDNQGMWNMRSAIWERQYLGQQFYLRVWTAEKSLANEYNIPSNALLCGKAAGRKP
ncbi:unnamed protein product [Linum tenue]|uniref:Uncharacterized protein n=1 Tax=Linum tenue TaxID=586396 RepID=A0AAV0R983_9ROSI|nr:unnamed protein product [Linum tenue]